MDAVMKWLLKNNLYDDDITQNDLFKQTLIDNLNMLVQLCINEGESRAFKNADLWLSWLFSPVVDLNSKMVNNYLVDVRSWLIHWAAKHNPDFQKVGMLCGTED